MSVSAHHPHIGESHLAKSCIAYKVSDMLGVSLAAHLGPRLGSLPPANRYIAFLATEKLMESRYEQLGGAKGN